MNRLFRGFFIVFIVLRYGLDELVLTSFQKPGLRLLARITSIGRDLRAPRGQRLREALGAAGVMVETVRGAGYRLTAQVQVTIGDGPETSH